MRRGLATATKSMVERHRSAGPSERLRPGRDWSRPGRCRRASPRPTHKRPERTRRHRGERPDPRARGYQKAPPCAPPKSCTHVRKEAVGFAHGAALGRRRSEPRKVRSTLRDLAEGRPRRRPVRRDHGPEPSASRDPACASRTTRCGCRPVRWRRSALAEPRPALSKAGTRRPGRTARGAACR